MANQLHGNFSTICRTCLLQINSDVECFPITVTDAENPLISKLKYCIPDLDFSLASSGVICNDCACAVTSAYKFKQKCLQIEMLVRQSIREMLDGNVNLVEILEKKQEEWYLSINGDIELPVAEACGDREINSVIKEEELSDIGSYSECVDLSITQNDVAMDLVEDSVNNLQNSAEGCDTNNQNSVVVKEELSKCNITSKPLLLVGVNTPVKDTNFAFLNKQKRKHTAQVAKNVGSRSSTVNLKPHKKHSKRFACAICGYSATCRDELQRHLPVHAGEQLYVCGLCNYITTAQSALNSHMQIHKDCKLYKVYNCNVCSYSTRAKGGLTSHMQIHLKPFQCIECKARFSSHDYLNMHLKVHIQRRMC